MKTLADTKQTGKKITVAVALNQNDLDQNGPQWEDEFETLKQAKLQAKRFLTDEYRNVIESSTRYGYAQVRINGECVVDYFSK